MRRIPKGFRKVQKDELFSGLSRRKSGGLTADVEALESRIGVDWSKLDDEKVTKQVIRW